MARDTKQRILDEVLRPRDARPLLRRAHIGAHHGARPLPEREPEIVERIRTFATRFAEACKG